MHILHDGPEETSNHDRYQDVLEGCLNPSRAFAAAAQVDCRKAKSLRHLGLARELACYVYG